jgi:peptidyl-prolyl cis-trans isomerase C
MALGVFSLIAATAVQAQSTATSTTAKVNGVSIPQSRLEFVMKARATQGQPDTPEARKTLRDDLISEEVIAQDALKKGLDKDPDFAAQLDMARQSALVRAYQVDYVKNHPVSDEELQKEYETLKAQMGDKEYKAHHILVGSEAEARTSLKIKGAKLEKIAQENHWTRGKSKGRTRLEPSGNHFRLRGSLTKLNKGRLPEQPVKPLWLALIRLMTSPPRKFLAGGNKGKSGATRTATVRHTMDLRSKSKIE